LASYPAIVYSAIKRNSGDGISNGQGSDATIASCLLEGNSGDGIRNHGSNPAIVSSAVKGNSGDGISNEQVSDATIGTCLVEGNGGNGIRNSFSSPTIVTSAIKRNSGSGISNNGNFQDNLGNKKEATIGTCLVEENGTAANKADGILNVHASPTIGGSVIRGNKGSGISNESQASPPIVGCKVEANGGDGIKNTNLSNPAILSCGVVGNDGHGISNGGSAPTNGSSPQIQGSVIAYNKLNGVDSVGQDPAMPMILKSSTMAFNAGDGISCKDVPVAIASENTVAGNTGRGVFLENSSPAVSNNQITLNSGNGIVVTGAGSAPALNYDRAVGNGGANGANALDMDIEAGTPNVAFCVYDKVSVYTGVAAPTGAYNLNSAGQPFASYTAPAP
jgi:hypothetical protein